MPIRIYVYITKRQISSPYACIKYGSTLTAGTFSKSLNIYLMSKYIEHQNELKISKTFKNIFYEECLKNFINLVDSRFCNVLIVQPCSLSLFHRTHVKMLGMVSYAYNTSNREASTHRFFKLAGHLP